MLEVDVRVHYLHPTRICQLCSAVLEVDVRVVVFAVVIVLIVVGRDSSSTKGMVLFTVSTVT